MASNSEKQRALYRSREAAKANGTLPAWYAAREADRAARVRATSDATQIASEAAPAPTPVAPATPYESPEAVPANEAAAWRAAYEGQGHGPISCRWVQSGARLTCQWLLGTNSGSHRPTPPRG